ncbi:MAG TPA: hypothetical protein VF668_16885 [Pyrinomonadaceae bacterium]|jgi:hypothetical protein
MTRRATKARRFGAAARLPLALLLAAPAPPAAAARAPDAVTQRAVAERVVRGSLAEVKGLRRTALLASRSLVVDAREPALAALEDYRRALAGEPPRQHVAAARLIAGRLNKYIRKYRMMTAAEDVAQADLVLVFQVTGQRRSAIPGEPFVWGKLYAIAVGRDRAPRLVWESEGDGVEAQDAADDFLKAFKAARGEK